MWRARCLFPAWLRRLVDKQPWRIVFHVQLPEQLIQRVRHGHEQGAAAVGWFADFDEMDAVRFAEKLVTFLALRLDDPNAKQDSVRHVKLG